MDQQTRNRIMKSHRFSQVPCAQTHRGPFLLIPAPASQSKLIIPPALTCSGANASRSSSTTWRNYTRMRSSTSSRSWPAWRRRSPTSHTREPETFRCVSGSRPHVRNEPKVTPPQIHSVIQELFLMMSLSGFKIGYFRYQACLANEFGGRGDKKEREKKFLVLIYLARPRNSLSFSFNFVLRFFIGKGLVVVHKILFKVRRHITQLRHYLIVTVDTVIRKSRRRISSVPLLSCLDKNKHSLVVVSHYSCPSLACIRALTCVCF